MAALRSLVTPLILTFNEEANIGRVLERLSWASRVVILDSYSTDSTLRIARGFPSVEVLQRRFDNHTDQWNFGLNQVRTPWVLTLDADYVLDSAWYELVNREASEFDKAGYYARFRYCALGRPLRGSLYPPRIVLFQRTDGRYVQDGHTQRLAVEGTVGFVDAPILHDDRKPLSSWLEAQSRYTDLEVVKLRETAAAHLGLVDRLRKQGWIMPLLTPFYCFVIKGLIFDGLAGSYYTFQRTYAETLLALRLIDSKTSSRPETHLSEEIAQIDQSFLEGITVGSQVRKTDVAMNPPRHDISHEPTNSQ